MLPWSCLWFTLSCPTSLPVSAPLCSPDSSSVSCSLYSSSVFIYFSRSYLCLPLSIPPPALLSFIFHSQVLPPANRSPPSAFPSHWWMMWRCVEGLNLRSGGSLRRAISKPIPLIAIAGCCYMTLQLSPVEQEKASGLSEFLLQVLLRSDCRTQGQSCCCYITDQFKNVLVWSSAMLAPGSHTGPMEADWKSTLSCSSAEGMDCRRCIVAAPGCFILLCKCFLAKRSPECSSICPFAFETLTGLLINEIAVSSWPVAVWATRWRVLGPGGNV